MVMVDRKVFGQPIHSSREIQQLLANRTRVGSHGFRNGLFFELDPHFGAFRQLHSGWQRNAATLDDSAIGHDGLHFSDAAWAEIATSLGCAVLMMVEISRRTFW
jgi:hypothetical protein